MNLQRKFWFKWQQLKARWDESAGGSRSYDTSHRMCPSCRALIDRSAKVCPLCGAKIGSARARGSPGSEPERIMGVIPVPTSATSAFAAACIALYIITWFMTARAGAVQSQGLFGMGGISGRVLVRMGAKFGYAMIIQHQWWRLVTAIFLHAGLLHIGLNMWCLFDLGPEVESLFSTTKFIVLYLATGVFGYIVSLWWSPMGISIGASGAIMGLVGILIGASFHHGHLGKEYRSMLWKWVIYIFALGLLPYFIPIGLNLDNAAHFGGLALGLLLGYVLPTGEPRTQSEQNLWNALAVISILVIAGSFALMALQINQVYS